MDEQLFEYAPDAMLAADMHSGHLIKVNLKLLAMTLFHAKDLLSQNIQLIFPKALKLGGSIELLTQPGLHEDVDLLRADGTPLKINVAVAPIPDTSMCVLRLHDRTQRHQLEGDLIANHLTLRQTHEDLLRVTGNLRRSNHEIAEMSSKMAVLAKQAAVGEFTAGVAHGINNPLAASISIGRRMNRYVAQIENPKLRSELARLRERQEEANRRIQQVVEELRLVHRGAAPRGTLAPVSLKQEIEAALTLFAHRLMEINVVKQFNTVPKVMASPDELQHLFCNLIDNAISAMGSKGTLTLSIKILCTNIEVHISDTGSGIPETLVHNVFEPFVTCRQGGTGLGLCVSHRIAEQHGGKLFIAQTSHEGTTLCLQLPNTPPSESQKKPT